MLTLMILAAGTLVTAIVCIPPWPFYKKNPVKWLPNLPKDKVENKKNK